MLSLLETVAVVTLNQRDHSGGGHTREDHRDTRDPPDTGSQPISDEYDLTADMGKAPTRIVHDATVNTARLAATRNGNGHCRRRVRGSRRSG